MSIPVKRVWSSSQQLPAPFRNGGTVRQQAMLPVSMTVPTALIVVSENAVACYGLTTSVDF